MEVVVMEPGEHFPSGGIQYGIARFPVGAGADRDDAASFDAEIGLDGAGPAPAHHEACQCGIPVS
jgi:hypothetical protein